MPLKLRVLEDEKVAVVIGDISFDVWVQRPKQGGAKSRILVFDAPEEVRIWRRTRTRGNK